MRPARSRYSEEEVRTLVEEYMELAAVRDTNQRGLRLLLSLADVTRVMNRLPLAQRDVVILHGIMRLTNEAAGRLLEISEAAVRKRYRLGLENMLYDLNGGEG